MKRQKTITPVDGSVYVERDLASNSAIERALVMAEKAQKAWKQVPVAERAGDLPPHGRMVRLARRRARDRAELADGPAGRTDARASSSAGSASARFTCAASQ